MKTLYFFSFFSLFVCSISFAQTQLISHKSHSGQTADFENKGIDFYGLIPPEPVAIIWLSDTSCIEVTKYGSQEMRDTIFHHPIIHQQNLSLDSLQKLFQGFELRGFETDKKRARRLRRAARNSRNGSLLLVAFSLLMLFGLKKVFV